MLLALRLISVASMVKKFPFSIIGFSLSRHHKLLGHTFDKHENSIKIGLKPYMLLGLRLMSVASMVKKFSIQHYWFSSSGHAMNFEKSIPNNLKSLKNLEKYSLQCKSSKLIEYNDIKVALVYRKIQSRGDE